MEKKLKGFTIIELMVVLTIIAVLCAIGVPAAMTWVRDAKIRDANEEARLVYSAVQDYLTELEIKNIELESGTPTTIIYSKSNGGMSMPGIDAGLNASAYGGFNMGANFNNDIEAELIDFSDALGDNFDGAWAASIRKETYTVIAAYWMPLPNGAATYIDTGAADFADANAQESYYNTNGVLFGKFPM